TNRIVLQDELCSREHAEVYYTDDRWHVRDMNSLNGTRVNAKKVTGECPLSPQDVVGLGRTSLVFVEKMTQLPDLPFLTTPDSVAIKKRLSQTRFSTPLPPTVPAGAEVEVATGSRHPLSRDLARLYRLALDMGSTTTTSELVGVVLQGLL